MSIGKYMEQRWDRMAAAGQPVPWDYKKPGFIDGLNSLFSGWDKEEHEKQNAWFRERGEPEISFDKWKNTRCVAHWSDYRAAREKTER